MSHETEVGCNIISDFSNMVIRHQNELTELIANSYNQVNLSMADTDSCMMSKWAQNEIAIACSRERDSTTSADEWNYGVECYTSALRAFQSLLGYGQTEFSMTTTKNILISLIEHRPLTPIEDIEDQWINISEYGISDDMACIYQNSRYSALFKKIYNDGRVVFQDVESHYCVDINEPTYNFHSSTIQQIMDLLYPVTLPYYPQPKLAVYVDCANESFGILYTIDQNGKKTNIYKYYQQKEDKTIIKISRRTWSKIKMFGVKGE